jgi:hypothetical protein
MTKCCVSLEYTPLEDRAKSAEPGPMFNTFDGDPGCVHLTISIDHAIPTRTCCV